MYVTHRVAFFLGQFRCPCEPGTGHIVVAWLVKVSLQYTFVALTIAYVLSATLGCALQTLQNISLPRHRVSASQILSATMGQIPTLFSFARTVV